MPSSCPKCHRTIEEDSVCCADVRYSWKCTDCGKLTQGFVVPYGRCFLCGGKIEVVGDRRPASEAIEMIRSAVQLEVDMFHFYRLATAKVGEGERREVLEDLYSREAEHFHELSDKYHLDLDERVLEPSAEVDAKIESELFDGIDVAASDPLRSIYAKALELEMRTYRFFAERAAALPEGPERELCRELAAEEEEHIALIETELENLTGAERD